MQTCEKNNLLKKEGTEPSDEEFKVLLKELFYYNEVLKCNVDQMKLSSALKKAKKSNCSAMAL
jgi:hypothetical protein